MAGIFLREARGSVPDLTSGRAGGMADDGQDRLVLLGRVATPTEAEIRLVGRERSVQQSGFPQTNTASGAECWIP